MWFHLCSDFKPRNKNEIMESVYKMCFVKKDKIKLCRIVLFPWTPSEPSLVKPFPDPKGFGWVPLG